MVEAATEFKKSGYSDDDAAQLALVAQMYRNVADEQLDAGTAANFIVSQMKAFNLTAEDSQHIIDAVNEVSNNYAVSSSDLARNIGNASAAMAAGGNTMEQTLGMMTAMTEITRSGSKASRGLVTIQSRYNQILDESSSTGKKLTDFYTKHGIQLKDETGQLRSMYDVLGDLSSKWGGLTDDEKKYFALIQGGATQTQNLMALMSNFGTAIDATKTAMESSGSAAQENAAAMESLQKKIDNLKAAWENFATGTATKEFLSGIIDAGARLLEFANTDMGIAITKAILFGTTLGSAAGFLGTFISKIAEGISAFKKLKSGVDIATGAVGALAKAKWTVIALGIAGITTVIIALAEAIKNSQGKFDKFMSEFDKSKQKTEEYQRSLDDAKKKLEELNDIPYADRTSEQQHEIEVLKDQIEQYEKLIELEKQRQSEALKSVSDAAIGSGVKMGVKRYDFTPSAITSFDVKTLTDKQKAAVDALPQTFNNVTEAIDAYANALGLSWAKADGTIKTTEEMREELKQYGLGVADVNATLEDSAVDFQNLANSINQSAKPTQEQLDLAKNYIDANKDIADSLWARMNNGDKLSEAESQWLLNYNNLLNAYENGQAAVEKYSASVKTAQDTLSKFPEAEQASRSAIESVAKALVNNSDLGIQSAEQLKSALQNLADGGVIDLSRIGNIDEFIAKLIEANNIKFDDKNINVETNAEEANNELAELDTEDEQKQITVTTAEEGQALASALQEISSWIDQVNGKTVKVTLEADVSAAKQQVNSVTEEINDMTAGVDVMLNTNAEEIVGRLQAVQSVANAISSLHPRVTVTANTSSAMSALRAVAGYSLPNKSFYVTALGNALTVLSSASSYLNSLHDKTITVTVNYKTTGTPPKATGSDGVQAGTYLINDGAPVNGSRAELVVSNGVGQIYNDGDTTIQSLPHGAKIYTAAETQKLLKDRGLTVDDVAENPIPALANGTKNNKYPDYRNDPTYSGVTKLSGSGDDLKENFDEWLKEKKHWLNMDIISEAQYYRDLEIMNERYLKNLSDAKDEYWQHEEEIYKYQNQSLEDQIKLEEKLSDLAKAKENRVLAFSGGRFQYLQNLDAIAKAQREVDQITGKYANGTTNARGGLSLVGENGPEMRVLGRGDGIIPAEATKNLMALSSLNIKDALSNIGRAIVTNYSFDISRLELPSVSNAGEFLDGLKNLAYQYSYARA